MLVFKFGGASVQSAEAVRNVAEIVRRYANENLVIVVSAMGKTTNELEKIAHQYFHSPQTAEQSANTFGVFDDMPEAETFNPFEGKASLWGDFERLRSFHFKIVNQLMPNPKNRIFAAINLIFDHLLVRLKQTPSMDYDYEYDQIVSFGEIISTKIISLYMEEMGIANKWIDVRRILKTNHQYREPRINWELSEKLMHEAFDFEKSKIYVAQGFIGSTTNNQTTTLGREGSDFTAAVVGHIMNAENVTIWKDVGGVHNADPKLFPNSIKIDALSYSDAVELAFFGAKVIHPKTIKPLQNKRIPLFVKSFLNPELPGTIIGEVQNSLSDSNISIFIVKQKQVLISISPNDFSFIAEESMSKIFNLIAQYKVRVQLMQNSAISFAVCADNLPERVQPLISELSKEFTVDTTPDAELVTIIQHTPDAVKIALNGKKQLISQTTQRTARFVVKAENQNV